MTFEELKPYIETIPRVQEKEKEGWRLDGLDYLSSYVYFSLYIGKKRVIRRGKIKEKEIYQYKRLKLTKEEQNYLGEVSRWLYIRYELKREKIPFDERLSYAYYKERR